MLPKIPLLLRGIELSSATKGTKTRNNKRQIIGALLAALIVLMLRSTATAQEKETEQQVIDKVKEAAIMLSKTRDVEQLRQKGWVWKGTYIFVVDCEMIHAILHHEAGYKRLSNQRTEREQRLSEGGGTVRNRPPGSRGLVALKTNSNKTFLAVRPCFNDLGRRDTFRAMSPGFDLPIALLWSRSPCGAASRGVLCRNLGSRRMRVQLDHGAAMSCADERNQTNKQEAISTSS